MQFPKKASTRSPPLTGLRHRELNVCSSIVVRSRSARQTAVAMDPYSAEGELINIHNHFHQGQYQEVVDFDTSVFSAENALPARVLVLRARIALGQAEDVLADVKGESEPDLEVMGAFAEYTLGKTDAALQTVEKLASSAADNVTVQVIGGTVLQAAGKSEAALALLSRHQGSCKWDWGARDLINADLHVVEAVALIVQVHLQQNRTDLAVKEVVSARGWAQDSLLVNLAESWVGLRVVSCCLVLANHQIPSR